MAALQQSWICAFCAVRICHIESKGYEPTGVSGSCIGPFFLCWEGLSKNIRRKFPFCVAGFPVEILSRSGLGSFLLNAGLNITLWVVWI